MRCIRPRKQVGLELSALRCLLSFLIRTETHNGLERPGSPWKIWQGIPFWLSFKDTFRLCGFRIVQFDENQVAFSPQIPVSPRMKGQRDKISYRQVASE